MLSSPSLVRTLYPATGAVARAAALVVTRDDPARERRRLAALRRAADPRVARARCSRRFSSATAPRRSGPQSGCLGVVGGVEVVAVNGGNGRLRAGRRRAAHGCPPARASSCGPAHDARRLDGDRGRDRRRRRGCGRDRRLLGPLGETSIRTAFSAVAVAIAGACAVAGLALLDRPRLEAFGAVVLTVSPFLLAAMLYGAWAFEGDGGNDALRWAYTGVLWSVATLIVATELATRTSASTAARAGAARRQRRVRGGVLPHRDALERHRQQHARQGVRSLRHHRVRGLARDAGARARLAPAGSSAA